MHVIFKLCLSVILGWFFFLFVLFRFLVGTVVFILLRTWKKMFPSTGTLFLPGLFVVLSHHPCNLMFLF